MAKKVNDTQRRAILEMLAEGHDRETIAAHVGVTPGQVSAISAHVTMGTYKLSASPPLDEQPGGAAKGHSRAGSLLDELRKTEANRTPVDFEPVMIGTDVETDEAIYWNPSPHNGSANPHVLVLGESGFGKTYSICCLLTELAQRGLPSIVFDYAQGFSLENAPQQFITFANPVELDAARDGIKLIHSSHFRSICTVR